MLSLCTLVERHHKKCSFLLPFYLSCHLIHLVLSSFGSLWFHSIVTFHSSWLSSFGSSKLGASMSKGMGEITLSLLRYSLATGLNVSVSWSILYITPRAHSTVGEFRLTMCVDISLFRKAQNFWGVENPFCLTKPMWLQNWHSLFRKINEIFDIWQWLQKIIHLKNYFNCICDVKFVINTLIW